MKTGTTRVTAIDGVVVTIGEHVIAQEALAGGGEGIGVEETAEVGIVISALEVIERCFLVIDIVTVAQGVQFADGCGVDSDDGQGDGVPPADSEQGHLLCCLKSSSAGQYAITSKALLLN